jgi:glyceraldehyde-3-phosphate dehydrogenase/erythrose-4-phosphate dehydrogenase
VQILELIQEKKGIDQAAFKTIHADLDKLRSNKASRATEAAVKSPLPPPGNKSPPPPAGPPPPKKQRMD